MKLLRYLWASPATLVGMLLALPWLAGGASARAVGGVLEFSGGRFARGIDRLPHGASFGAITLGHVIIARDAQCLDGCRAHEHVHVRQYELWGVLFFPLYAASSAWQWVRGRDPYRDNAFERAAFRITPPRGDA